MTEYSVVILTEYPVVILGLDPRITLSAYWPPSSHRSVVRADAGARVEPEQDVRTVELARLRTADEIRRMNSRLQIRGMKSAA
jgi:hypothetical protein